MVPIPKRSWLPALASGARLGTMPENMQHRYVERYQTFAGSWPVTDEMSPFVTASGTSTATFDHKARLAVEPSCKLKPHAGC